ncbi:hypothetical protein HC928_09705, partial [bacterium]|nr:hypothetical protein [bacterium]
MLSNLPYDIVNGVPMTLFQGVGGAKLFLVNTMHEWRAFFQLLMQQQLVACDTETTGFYWYKTDEICGMSFGWKDMHFYVPVRHKESIQDGPVPGQLDMDDIRADLVTFFGDKTRTTVWFNAKFDLHFYKREGIDVKCQVQDASILWHFYDENAPGALKSIASGWRDDLGRQVPGLVDGAANIKEKEIDNFRSKEAKLRREVFRKLVMAKADELKESIEHQDKNRNQLKKWIANNLLQDHVYANSKKSDIDYSYVPIRLMTEYASLDTFLTYKVYEFCVKNLTWTKNLTALYKNEMELLRVLFNAEEHGVKIDVPLLNTAGAEFDQQIAELHELIRLSLGDINLQSTQQLAEALLRSGVNLTKQTDSSTETNKKYAVDKKVLEKLKGNHSIVKDILKLREFSKLKNTYVDGIMGLLTSDHILHCSFNQNVSTGRMSSRDPNLQNIPSKDKTIRSAFIVPSDEYYYLLADYSQIEVRLTAHYSQDPLLLDAYAKGQDIHTRTFCEMFGYDIDFVLQVLDDPHHPQHREFSLLRTVAKRINFGIIYGVGAPGLSEQIERPDQYKHLTDKQWVDVCQSYINQYLQKYVGVRRFVNQGNRLVARNAQVTNYFGRVRHLPHAEATKITGNQQLYWLEKRAERQGVNFTIQGCNDPAAPILTVAGYVPMNKLEAVGKPALVQYNGSVATDYQVLDTGEKACVEVITDVSTGWCSTEHKFFVLNPITMDLEFQSIKDLSVGTLVVGACAQVSGVDKARVTPELAELLGILIGDGSYGRVFGTNGSRKRRVLRNIVTVACGTSLSWATYVRDLVHSAFPQVKVALREVNKPHNNINYVVSFENKRGTRAAN